MVVRLLAVAGGLCAVAAPREARALPLLTFSASLRGLYGSVSGEPDLNPYTAGLGVRAGLTLPSSFYLGASVDYFFGESESVAGFDTSASVFQLLGNVGYDFGLGPLTLRPLVGLGYAQRNVDIGDQDASEGDFALSPGVEAIFGFGLLSVGGELRYNKVFADDDIDAVIVGLGLGLSL
jgi:Outer membrane protein beta-barrel domain